MASGVFNLKQQLFALAQRAWSGTQKTNYVEYLVVAGGGGAAGCGEGSGFATAGGGGAGGLLSGILPVTAGATGGNLVTAGGIGGVPVTAGGTSVSSVIINNGGTGYAINNILTIPLFAGATFTVTNVGSSILGIGVDTYIVASSGIGSEFIPDIDSTETSSCPTSCASYATQVDTLKADIVTLRSQRDAIMVGSNSIKVETKRSYVQQYSYNFAQAELNKRKTEINAVRFVLNNSTYNQYFS